MAKVARKSTKTSQSRKSKDQVGIDLSTLDHDDLVQLQKDIEAALRSYQKRRRDEALREMEKVAEKHGLALKDVVNGGRKRSVQVPKYRHPENPALTWSGRGRQPLWFKEAIDTGVKRDDLLIA
jgi:DNA-binding protein H-NS